MGVYRKSTDGWMECTQPEVEQASQNRLITITANSITEYARTLAAAEFGQTEEVEEVQAIAA